MTKSMTIEVEGVGSVLLEQSTRAKHLNINVQPYKGVRVAIPKGISFKQAEKVVHSKIDWIQNNQEKMKQIEREHAEAVKSLPPIDQNEARKKIVRRLEELAEKHGFKYNRVFIRQQKTRWGSCSTRNNISLNMKLVRLPEHLFDYVIIHELVHTKHTSHKKRFWNEMDKILGDAKTLRTELNQHRLELL